MSASLILDASFAAPHRKNGWVRLRLVNASPRGYTGFRLGVNSIVQLTPRDATPASLEHRIGSYHELAAPAGFVLEPGHVWDLGPLDLEYQLVHANDGPFRAFLVDGEGTVHNVQVAPVEKMPTVKVGDQAPPSIALDQPNDVTVAAWSHAAGCEARLFPDDTPALGTIGAPVTASIADRLGPEGFSIDSENGMHTVAGGSRVALQWALMELAKRQRGDTALVGSTFAPRYGVRGFALDLSRHFYPAVDVAEIIDAAAWRRLNVVHLHLTDDDAWRVPIAAYPELTEIGSWRGHGHAIPPLLGSGADRYGGSYTREQIRGWITQASALGIELVPEIDTPAHCYAAVMSLPHLLRDPDDTRTGESVHHFPHNTLNPGLPGTRDFLENVFGELADLFPSRALHMGCDEVPEGSWDHSPAAQRYAAERGIEGSRAIARAFMTEIGTIVKATGRRVNVWQEAAQAGSVQPGDGWVGAWKSSADCRTLAASGFDVIAMPAEAYYLDMATGTDFELPGHFWAGSIDDEAIRDFDPTTGWSDEERTRLVGVMACHWGEHIPDRSTLRRLVYQRLTTFADTAWRSV